MMGWWEFGQLFFFFPLFVPLILIRLSPRPFMAPSTEGRGSFSYTTSRSQSVVNIKETDGILEGTSLEGRVCWLFSHGFNWKGRRIGEKKKREARKKRVP